MSDDADAILRLERVECCEDSTRFIFCEIQGCSARRKTSGALFVAKKTEHEIRIPGFYQLIFRLLAACTIPEDVSRPILPLRRLEVRGGYGDHGVTRLPSMV